MKPVKRHRSWKVCPACSSRATKLFYMDTGKYKCQICQHQYDDPKGRNLLDKKYKFTILLGNSEQYQYTVYGDSLSQINQHLLSLLSKYDKTCPRPARVVPTPKGYPKGTRSVTVVGYTRYDGKRFRSIRVNMIPI
ncbi:hypothetical protein HQ81_0089 [Dickeya phage phiDP23.1]|uniref:Uncharacterized protein n=2 Tax=unclassified Aglimvirinae TaxID=2562724 RepID=A0A140XBK3_9CAUD|nr:hypothetical protein HQ82_0220 [Dickeya phage phiDP10.3]AIM51858.1 hypothetical protein HQ81_0089 [Dickeya phage phiDP23.1]